MQRFGITILLCFLSNISIAQDWELKKEESGILVYTKDNGTPYRSIQTVTVIKTSMPEVITMIFNVDRYPEWIFKCKAARILEKKSDTHLIYYQMNSVPFVSDRDMIIELTMKEDESGDVIITQIALPEYIPADEDLVRIRKFDGEWRLKSVENGIEVIYTCEADPGGGLPKRFVNKGMIDGPFETTFNMKRLLEEKVVAKKRRRQ